MGCGCCPAAGSPWGRILPAGSGRAANGDSAEAMQSRGVGASLGTRGQGVAPHFGELPAPAPSSRRPCSSPLRAGSPAGCRGLWTHPVSPAQGQRKGLFLFVGAVGSGTHLPPRPSSGKTWPCLGAAASCPPRQRGDSLAADTGLCSGCGPSWVGTSPPARPPRPSPPTHPHGVTLRGGLCTGAAPPAASPAGREAGRHREYERLLAQAGLLRRREATAQEEEETDRPFHDRGAHELRPPDAHWLWRHGRGRRPAHDRCRPGDEVQGWTGATVEQLPGLVAYSWLFQPKLELPDPPTGGEADLKRFNPAVIYAERSSPGSWWLLVLCPPANPSFLEASGR